MARGVYSRETRLPSAPIAAFEARQRPFGEVEQVAAGEHEAGNAGGAGGFEVCLFVADEEALLAPYGKICHCLQQHPRPRLAIEAVAPVVRVLSLFVERAVIDAVDVRALLGEPSFHPGVQRMHVRLCVEVARDPGLVGDDEHIPAARIEGRNRLGSTRDEFEIADTADIAAIHIDNAVAVKEQGRLRGGHAVFFGRLGLKRQSSPGQRMRSTSPLSRAILGSGGGQLCVRTVEEREATLEQYLPLIVSALGGTVLGPVIARLTGGTSTGGVLGGVLGGVAAHFGADAAGIGSLLGNTAIMGYLQSFIEGGVGGGLLGALSGLVMKRKA